jgi:hypothetical protein
MPVDLQQLAEVVGVAGPSLMKQFVRCGSIAHLLRLFLNQF